MKTIIKGRWFIFAIWLVATIVLTVISPDINAIMRNREQKILPDDSPSIIAEEINSKMSDAVGTSNILVFYDKDKISDDEMNNIEAGVKAVSDSSTELGIDEIMDPFSLPSAAGSLISEDGTTLMVSFKLDKQGREVSEIKDQFESKLSNVGVEYYLTGEVFINDDYQKQAEAGVTKSASLTVIFILVVLVIMFRSVVTPLISILSIAFAYLCSMGIAAQLIDKANFPLTSLTQMLMILILFGIGTDYNILLFNRFREELSKGFSVDDSIINTYKTAGKTIFFSIITVIIAFASLAFAESPTYQSGMVVAIGAGVLILEIVTLTPFVMKTFGNKLFWPSKVKQGQGHKDSKVWGKVATVATKHPIIAVIAVLLIIAPTIIFHQQKLSFDTIGELGDSAPSTKAFGIVADHFGKGQAMPSFVMIENKEALDNNEALAVIDDLAEKIGKIDGVSKVSSITRPEGTKIDAFYSSSRTDAVTDGATSTTNNIFNMPEGVLTNEAFQPALNTYFNIDRTVTMLNVVLATDPYSQEATDAVVTIRKIVSEELKGTVLADATAGVSGQTSYTRDMNDMLSRDLSRTSIIILIGVFLILVLVIRSFWTPVFITASLVGAFYAAMFVLNRVFINGMGYDGISSFVPFFSLIVIVALGVDYSIFLMSRFKECSELPASEAIVMACKKIGGVIMSAAVILAGTFATLMPSGLLLLIELAVGVIAGLIVLCFLMLPIFLPAMISLQEKIANLNRNKSTKKIITNNQKATLKELTEK